MPTGTARFPSDELDEVLGQYDLGEIEQVKPLAGGSGRVPKVVVVSDHGKFLLKRRRKTKDLPEHLTFIHQVQDHLRRKTFPVTSFVQTRAAGQMVEIKNRIYECSRFVTGIRYDGSADATTEAGRQLGKLHRALADFESQAGELGTSFHDSSTVRRGLKKTGSEKTRTPSKELHVAAEGLMTLYNASSVRVNELGFDSWPQQIVHGDWHPGNMLFSRQHLIAVLDFDSIKLAPRVTDLANGMLQFSIVGGSPNPADWPDHLDLQRLFQFLSGYREVLKIKRNQVDCLPDLMIETLIAEAILPVAATGSFGTLSGLDFLTMIRRKADWINSSRSSLEHALRP
jgi:Ser/Thr protein kinase RdoA (MazF antagonist)